MIQKAQKKIFFLVQQADLFVNEIKQLKLSKKVVPENINISQLDPSLDSWGILRVGGSWENQVWLKKKNILSFSQ